MAVDVLLGLQWGDEGKGKIVDVLTRKYDIIARFQGGPNAGHTLEFEGKKHVLHTIPSGVFHKDVSNIVGNGVVIDPVIFKAELDKLIDQEPDVLSRLKISRKAHLILPSHRLLDAASEAAKGKKKIGSTLKGIGPTYMDKTGRNGLRVGDIQLSNFKELYSNLVKKHKQLLSGYSDFSYDLSELETDWFAAIEYLRTLDIIDSEPYIHQAIKEGRTILAEGAQGTLLDIDFGTYPFVTSSNTTCAGACTGLGVAPNRIKNVYGIFKAYCTRVGSGPFPTELFDETGKTIQMQGHEFGATTGRPRRCGWLDLPALKYAIDVNGVTELMMMKSDVLSGIGNLKICTAYRYKSEVISHLPYKLEEGLIEPILTEVTGWNEDLTAMKSEDEFPASFKAYIDFIEKEVGVPISLISVGPDRAQTIMRK
ncbi:MAG: adenylosuccinate synthase [Flavobacteriales bacterium]|nr:adenylosuccinate synthase [Flavobacteriales bacterium]|tara:strand:- start:7235 stop:8506 length:1272 start_codon:yes stop_codon:yes gene_type:complete